MQHMAVRDDHVIELRKELDVQFGGTSLTRFPWDVVMTKIYACVSMSANRHMLSRVCLSMVTIITVLGSVASFAWAEDIPVVTLAGMSGPKGYVDGTGNAATLGMPWGITIDAAGNLYVADKSNYVIRKVTTGGVVSTLAGSPGVSGSTNGTGTAARFSTPMDVSVDAGGNLFVVDGNCVRKITSGGVVTTIAGDANLVGSLDGTGLSARFNQPNAITVDASGNLFVADTGNRTIRKITPLGVVTTLAGAAGQMGSTDGTGAVARFGLISDIALAPSGILYVTDSAYYTVRSISAAGIVATVAGLSGTRGTTDGLGSVARFSDPRGITVDSTGRILVADYGGATIRTMTSAGLVATLVGTPDRHAVIDGTGSEGCFEAPTSIATGSDGTVYVTESAQGVIRRVSVANVVTTYIGLPTAGYIDGTGSNARFNFFNWTSGLAFDLSGNLYVADSRNCVIRRVTPAGVVTTVAGKAGVRGNVDGTGSAARFAEVQGIVADGSGGIYIADMMNATIRRMTSAGVVTTVAGQAGQHQLVDGTGTAARFIAPESIARSSSGTLYISNGQYLRKMTSAGVVTTLTNVNNGTGVGSLISRICGLAVDSSGNVYEACSDILSLVKADSTGLLSRVAGGSGTGGVGNVLDGTGTAAKFGYLYSLALDNQGNFFIADYQCIRRMTSAKVVTTIARNLAVNPTSYDGVGSTLSLGHVGGLNATANGYLYFWDAQSYSIRVGTTKPTFVGQPQPVNKYAGQTASFTISTVGLATQTYQWSKSTNNGSTWTAITGATSTTYTTPVVALADSGGLYRCVATNAQGTATSSSAQLTVLNSAPTVVTPAAASAVALAGKTTALSVLGADDGGATALTYTWVATGPDTVTYSANGTNAARASTATFKTAGVYTFTVTIRDVPGLTVTSTTAVVNVAQAATTETVTPTPSSVVVGLSQTYTASMNDQFGKPMLTQPTHVWTLPTGGGTWTPSGSTCVFTAATTTGGPYSLKATVGAKVGTAVVTVVNAAPTIQIAAAATPSPVTGKTANLTVLGSDDGGELNLVYQWAKVSAPIGGDVTFSDISKSHAARDVVATFTKAGAYSVKVTISDKGGKSVVSTIGTISVVLTTNTVVITPASVALLGGATQQFAATAYDQFNVLMSPQPSFSPWLANGGGSMTSTGLFTAGAVAGGPYQVTTSKGGSATVTVTKTVSGLTWANPASITLGTPLGATQCNAQTAIAGTITYVPPIGTILTEGYHVLRATFRPTNSAQYSAAQATVTLRVIDPAPPTTTYEYDDANRLTDRIYADGKRDVFVYDDAGRMTDAVSQRYNNTVKRFYDTAGRLETEQLIMDGSTRSVGYGYDNANRLTTQTYPDTSVVGRTYTARNQLETVTWNGSPVISRTYSDSGLLQTTTYGQQIETETRTYEPGSSMVATIKVPGVTDFSYEYDTVWRKKTESDLLATSRTQHFRYDNEDRLTSWSRGSSSQTWDLSAVGDWNSTTRDGVTENREHTAVHEIKTSNGIPLAYDQKGNLTRTETGQGFVWDVENRLLAADTIPNADGAADTAKYAYDALGRRVAKTVFGTTTLFVHDGVRVIQEIDAPTKLPASAAADDGSLDNLIKTPAGAILPTTYDAQGNPQYPTRINYQPATTTIPQGFLADKSKDFATRTSGLSYGWVAPQGTPTRDDPVIRNFMPLPQYDTFVPAGDPQVWTWQIALPEGSYPVVLVMGDATNREHTFNITVQGETFNDPHPYNPLENPGYEQGRFVGVSKQVTVGTNGLLTIQAAAGALKPVLCFIEIGAQGTQLTSDIQQKLADEVAHANARTGGSPFWNGNKAETRTYVWGSGIDELVAYQRTNDTGSKLYYVHNNALWSVAAVTDSSGAVVERSQYDAFGKKTLDHADSNGRSIIGLTRGFCGYELDEETGMYYARARMYSPMNGRFASRDPAARNEAGLPTAGDGYQDGYSLYRAYFVPNATDPTGLGVNGPERYMVVGVSGYSGEPSGAWSVARDLKAKKIGFDESLEMGHMFWAPDANYGKIRNWMKDDKSQGGCECKSIMIISISWGARNATYVAEWFERTYGFKAAAQGIVEGVAPIPFFGGGGGAWNRIGPAKVMVNYYVGTQHWPTGAAISGAVNHDMSGEVTPGRTGMDLHIEGEWIGARHVQNDFIQARLLTSCGH
jgi:RHS repeat-associated protein